MTDGEFPSVRYVYDSLATRLGAEVVRRAVSRRRRALRRRGAHPRRRSTTAPRSSRSRTCSSRARSCSTSAPIAEKCRQVGALLVLDAYQSVGTLPFSVDALGVDALVGGVLKWLCGGPGGAFLYVRPESRAQTHAGPDRMVRAPGSLRVRAASDPAARRRLPVPARHAPIPALYAAREGPRIVRGSRPPRDSREVAPADLAADRPRLGARRCSARHAIRRAGEAPPRSSSTTPSRSLAS